MAFLLGKGCLSVELSVTPTKAIAKILLNTIKKYLQSKKYFIRLVGVLVIQWTKDTIGLI